jgi:hypothetical protein
MPKHKMVMKQSRKNYEKQVYPGSQVVVSGGSKISVGHGPRASGASPVGSGLVATSLDEHFIYVHGKNHQFVRRGLRSKIGG